MSEKKKILIMVRVNWASKIFYPRYKILKIIKFKLYYLKMIYILAYIILILTIHYNKLEWKLMFVQIIILEKRQKKKLRCVLKIFLN